MRKWFIYTKSSTGRRKNFKHPFDLFLFLFLFLTAISSFGTPGSQNSDTLTKKDTIPPSARFVFALDFRNSFVANSPVSIYGFQTGVKIKNRHLISLGIYTLTGQAEINNKRKQRPRPFEVTLLYGSLCYAYSIVNTKRIELSLPLEAGFGISRIVFIDKNEQPLPGIKPKHSAFVPLQAGVKLEWRLTRWIGFNGSVGYRNSILETDIRQDFDGMYYNLSAAIYFGNIIADLKKWRSRKNEKK